MGDAPHQIGPYKIVREVGRGGMGVVYLARDDLNLREWIIPVTVDQDRIRTGKPVATGRAIDEGIAEMDMTSDGAMLVIRRGDDERWATRLELVQNWLSSIDDASSD